MQRIRVRSSGAIHFCLSHTAISTDKKVNSLEKFEGRPEAFNDCGFYV